MIGASMVLGIGTSVAANPCMMGAAGAMLESFREGKRPARAARASRVAAAAEEKSAGLLRIAHAPALAWAV